MIWNKLLETYDNNRGCADIAPVAHTKIKAHIGILIDSIGIFRMAVEIPGVSTIIPCTAMSECRSSNIAPHPIHDNLSYVGVLNGYEKRHTAYMKQLHDYAFNTNCRYAKAIYNYLKKETIMLDISCILQGIKEDRIFNRNVVFCVYNLKENSIDLNWTNYYVKTLPKNGVCAITGEKDYIPKSYPVPKRHDRDLAKLIVSTPNQKIDSLLSNEGFGAGYIASQKCLHTLEALVEDDKSYILDNNIELKNLIGNTTQGIKFLEEGN